MLSSLYLMLKVNTQRYMPVRMESMMSVFSVSIGLTCYDTHNVYSMGVGYENTTTVSRLEES